MADEQEVQQPPQVAVKRPTPEVVMREIRKFALDQAVQIAPNISPASAPGGVIGIAAAFEDYILNGKQDNAKGA